MALIHFARHSFGFECGAGSTPFCSIAKSGLLAGYGLAATLALLGLFDRRAFAVLLRNSDLRPGPLALNAIGLALLIASLPLLRWPQTPALIASLFALWGVATGALLAGTVLMISPLRIWSAVAARFGWVALPVLVAGSAAPFLASALRPLWDAELLAARTFDAVLWLLNLWGTAAETRPGARVVGADNFYVNIAPSCSGIEGLVLTLSFATLYMVLFRRDLRFPHALLILPVALCASWALNVLRIAGLVQLGISGFPALAIGGFHSHAGWLMFTLLSLGIVVTAQAVPFFHRARPGSTETAQSGDTAPRGPTLPFFEDPVVAQIFPFLVFMASALLASTFAQEPALAYPVRVAAMAVVLLLFQPYLERLPWRVDPLAVLTGLAVAALWIVAAPAQDTPHPVTTLAPWLAVVWVIARCIGTALLVPVIEELFFRGYLLSRLAPTGAAPWRVALAVLISTSLFAALHGRWIEAALAGMVFAALTLRSGRVTDAILAHALANGLIALWALATGNWAMI